MKQRKVPLRKCVACQEMKPKKELLRIVRTPDQQVEWDPTGKVSGRGAYICASRSCLDAAEKKNTLERALKFKVGAEVYSALREQIGELAKGNDGS